MLFRSFLVASVTILLLLPRASLAQSSQSFADVIEQAEKSVIRIEVSGDEGESLGSGFVIDNEGTFITNCHVLAGARRATAYFPNGQSSPVLGTLIIDQTRDIIVAKIRIKTAPALPIAPSLPRKGEEVMALGAPKGLSFSATKGIVSAIRPAKEMAEDIGRSTIQGTWIQVDAPISPGNSGGPLINSRGEVVAMSTLASQGSAQNLNFGISAKDIANAIKYSPYGKLASLSDAAAKVRMSDSDSPGPGIPVRPDGGILVKKSLPDAALQQYIKEARENYKELMRGLRMESARLSADLKEMRKGISRLPPDAARQGITVLRVSIPGRRERQWYFLNQNVKENAISEQQTRIRQYTQLKNQVKSIDAPESMFELLWNYGPPINIRDEYSVGFITDLFVVHALNGHDVMATYDEKPYLLYLNSTAGFSGGEIISGPIFIAGTATAVAESGLTTALTVFQEVTKGELREAIDDYFSENADELFRIWRAKKGNYSVKAKLLGADKKKAVLQKSDGTILNVEIESLSEEDQALIRNIDE